MKLFYKLNFTTVIIPLIAMSFHFANAQLSQADFLEKTIQNSWGLRNKGENLVFDLNPLQTYRLQARLNQDIHLASPIQGKKIRVAVIDTGVDVNHPLLKNKIFRKPGECLALAKYEKCVEENGVGGCSEILSNKVEGMDTDKNEYPADCHGWSILGQNTAENIVGTPSFNDDIGHGTHVAGIVASVSNNIEIVPIQVIGEAPNEPVKPFSIDLSPSEDSRDGSFSGGTLADRIARGIIYAIHAKVDVINLSLGWPQAQDADIMREAIDEAQKRGIIVVAAAGNDSTTALLRPCQYKGVICVAAHRPDGSIAHFSNFGFGVDIAAPGTSIVSTIPMVRRSIRLPGFSGVDILSGTSQASPYVAGVVAEMLSRGIKPEEIYPRLMLGARALMAEKAVLVGPIETAGVPVLSREPYLRTVLSGLLDMQNSLNIKSQPLILNADKEIPLIKWDRQSKQLHFDFTIKNYWQSIQNKKIDVKISLKDQLKIMPMIEKVELTSKDLVNFQMGEEKNISVDLAITDQLVASKSQLPSDLQFSVDILIDGQLHKTFEMRAEVVVEITKDYVDEDVTVIPVNGKLERGMRKYFIDEVYDGQVNSRDYFALSREEKGFLISLIKFEKNRYNISTPQLIAFEGKIQNTKPYSRIRMDIDSDGISEYILGIQEFVEDTEGNVNFGDYIMHFYIFDQNLKLKKHIPFYDNRALISLDYSWIKVDGQLRPAWVGFGKNVIKQFDITDLWQVNIGQKPPSGDSDIRFYYLDKDFKLATLENQSGFKVVDILQPRIENIKQGILPVLLAKNLGTEVKPSYLNAFAIGWVTNGVLQNQIKGIEMKGQLQYRNLIDTKKDKTVSLAKTSDEYLGTFWFGFDAHQKQRVTLIDYATNSIVDQLLPSDRSLFDSPLRVRAAFSSGKQKGVFLITNTEIEYHNLATNKTSRSSVARSSLNKYTYIGEDLIVDLQFPISLTARGSQEKIPALFTTEGSGLNRGVRFLVPTEFGESNNYKMVSPARLRLSSPEGCKAVDAPVYINGQYHLDYDCGDKILRFKLVY